MTFKRRKMHLLLGATAAAVLAGIPTTADARKKKGKKGGKKKSRGTELPKITKKGPTYFILNRKNYEVTKETKFKVDGKEVDFKKVKPGMKALVTGRVMTYGRTSATTIYEARTVTAYSK